jgi:ribose transport system ATP-binding protein
MAIVVVSSELPEILCLSDRVMVMSEGRLTATFQAAEANEDNILKAAIPKTI